MAFIAWGCKPPADASLSLADTSREAQSAETDYKRETLQKMQGRWVHTQDSLATSIVKGNWWIDEYLGSEKISRDSARIEVTNTSRHVRPDLKPTVILKIDDSDTLEYEMMGLSDSLMSLMYYANGRIHVYRRIAEK